MTIQIQKPDELQQAIRRLNVLAVNGLASMFDPQKQLFCYTLKQTKAGMVQEGISERYTAFTLLGLHKLREAGGTPPVDIDAVLDALLANTAWINNIGDLGLLMWACATVAPERLNQVSSLMNTSQVLSHFADARQARTMELAWFLAGLSHAGLACPNRLPEFRDVALETYRLLIKNQGQHGMFGHLARNKSLSGMARSRVGSFADQVYPIYAMTRFGQAYRDEHATQRALDCAIAICEAQGPRGQWWWHYDSHAGTVVDGFPVFSVHQHGMAPMCLFALGEAIQSDFSPWIYNGLRWIGHNELDFDMQDDSTNVVWRSIFRPISRKYWSIATGLLNRSEHTDTTGDLKVLFECRPYELGFLLYAFADKIDQ